MTNEDLVRLQAIQQHIEDAKYSDFDSSPTLIYNEIVSLNAWKSFTGKLMAEAKKELLEAKESAYYKILAEDDKIAKKLATSLLKDYISTKAANLQYQYDLAERTNSACSYSMEGMRSILSALKQEMQTLNYTGNITHQQQ